MRLRVAGFAVLVLACLSGRPGPTLEAVASSETPARALVAATARLTAAADDVAARAARLRADAAATARLEAIAAAEQARLERERAAREQAERGARERAEREQAERDAAAAAKRRAAAPTAAPASTPEQVCAEAWKLVPAKLVAHLDAHGTTFACRPNRKGYLGLYHTGSNKIELFVRTGYSARQMLPALLHEIGHAVDFNLVRAGSDAHRGEWERLRGLDMCWMCFGGHTDDRYGGAGDFAEAFAQAYAGSSKPRLGAYTAGQLAYTKSRP